MISNRQKSWKERPALGVKHEQGGLISARDQLFMIGGRTTTIEVLDNESNSWKTYPITVPAILNSFEVENIGENVYIFGGYGFLEQEYSGTW